MPTPHAVSVSLPADIVQMLKDKISTGQYASESDVIREGLRALHAQNQAQDQVIENWLRDEVTKSINEVAASPDSVIPVEEVLIRIKNKNMGARG